MTKPDVRIILCTCPNGHTRQIARTLVDERLVACVNIVPGVQSVYRWEGVIEEAQEDLMVMKTTASKVFDLKHAIGRVHPYDVPEIIVVDVLDGQPNYLAWVADSVGESEDL